MLPVKDHIRLYKTKHPSKFPNQTIPKRGALKQMIEPVATNTYLYDHNHLYVDIYN